MIKEWIAEYGPKNEEEILSALREIMQEITLAGLSRTDFYEKAAFYGGTALRIFYVKCYTKPSLFAGKVHALLFRKWKDRVKGRDWYNLEWYIKKGIDLDTDHFLARAKDTGNWKEDSISPEDIMELLHKKIESVSFKSIKEDVVRFIKNDEVLNIWGPEYFNDLIEKIKFKNT